MLRRITRTSGNPYIDKILHNLEQWGNISNQSKMPVLLLIYSDDNWWRKTSELPFSLLLLSPFCFFDNLCISQFWLLNIIPIIADVGAQFSVHINLRFSMIIFYWRDSWNVDLFVTGLAFSLWIFLVSDWLIWTFVSKGLSDPTIVDLKLVFWKEIYLYVS